MPVAGVVDDQPAHHTRGISHESRWIRERWPFSSRDIEIRLMKKSSRAEGYGHALPSKFPLSQPMQLGIQFTEERFCRGTITPARLVNQRRYRGLHEPPPPTRKSVRESLSYIARLVKTKHCCWNPPNPPKFHWKLRSIDLHARDA